MSECDAFCINVMIVIILWLTDDYSEQKKVSLSTECILHGIIEKSTTHKNKLQVQTILIHAMSYPIDYHQCFYMIVITAHASWM